MTLDYGPDGATARFSECRRYRYTLRRVLREGSWRVVWLMLNPSTADAFKLDPTVSRCVEFTRRWGADITDVVNVFALRSPYPTDLYAELHAPDAPCAIGNPFCTKKDRCRSCDPTSAWERMGADVVNDIHILEACEGAKLVIAAWGNHGDDPKLGNRGAFVRRLLGTDGIVLHHLGTSQSGSPLHPLARGKSFIPYEREPVRWDAAA